MTGKTVITFEGATGADALGQLLNFVQTVGQAQRVAAGSGGLSTTATPIPAKEETKAAEKVEEPAKEEKKKARAPKTAEKEEEKVEEKAAPAVESHPSEEDARDAIRKVNDEFDLDAAQEILKKFGVAKAGQLAPEKRQSFIDACKKKIESKDL